MKSNRLLALKALILQKYQLFTVCLLALLSTCGIYRLLFQFSVDNAKRVIWFVVFLFCAGAIKKALEVKNQSSAQRLLSLVFAFLFACFTVIGDAIHKHLSLWVYSHSASAVLVGVFLILSFTVLYDSVLVLVFDFISRKDFLDRSTPLSFFSDNRRSFFVVWGVIVFCWIPYLLLYSPGGLSNDSINQLNQVLGNSPLSNHHPVIHTGFIALFVKIGQAFGSLMLGILLHSIAQMLILSAVFSYTLVCLSRMRVPRFYRFLLLAYYALFPINALYSITMWKDILFGAFSLLLILFLIDMIRRPEEFFRSFKKLAEFCAVIFVFCVFRNNGFYAFVLFTPVLFFSFRKFWKQQLCLLAVCFVLISVYKGPLFSLLNVKEGSIGESMSVPMQQLARTVRDHRDTLTQDELEAIGELLPADRLAELYNPRLSDPVKREFNDEMFAKNKSRYLSLWFSLFLKYPKTYIMAFLCNSYGYWYPDVAYWDCRYGVKPNSLGVSTQSVLPKALAEKVRILNTEILPGIPGVSMLYSIGFSVWLAMIAVCVCVIKKRRNLLLPFVLLGCLWLTVLASPVHSEYRYMYGLILSIPVCIGAVMVAEHFPAPAGKTGKN